MPGKTVAIFAGPSGGHLFPALAYAETLREKMPDSRRFLISSTRAKAFAGAFAPGLFDEVFYLREFPFPSGFSLRSARFLLEFPRAFLESGSILKKIRPDLCAGFGSFVSYPGMILASWKKIPTWIHEQNQAAGKATKMLVKHVDGVAVTFPATFAGQKLRRLECVGLPIRRELRDWAGKTDKAPSKNFRILVTGGSQGSRNLNRVILETFSLLSSEEKKNIAVTHITGPADFENIREFYRKNAVAAEVHVFHSKMHELYSGSDMAITRAGANTLFELAMFGVPAVVIPYPYAGGHQAENAQYFEAEGALLMHEEHSLTSSWLLGQIQKLRDDSDYRTQLSGRMARMASPEASERLVRWTQEFLGERHG